MILYGKTDIGQRRMVNQDSFVIKKIAGDVLYTLVCDGMGGVNGGDIASTVAIRAFQKKVDAAEAENPAFFGMSPDDIFTMLKEAVADAGEAVLAKADEDLTLHDMGTTLVGCIVIGDDVYAVNVGDSRLYHISADGIKQITKDHSYVQELVDSGLMTPEEAKTSLKKNIITRCIGMKSVEPDVFSFTVADGDAILLCSDGLINHVEPEEIAEMIAKSRENGEMQTACETMINCANSRGGFDNITAVVLSI